MKNQINQEKSNNIATRLWLPLSERNFQQLSFSCTAAKEKKFRDRVTLLAKPAINFHNTEGQHATK